MMSATRGRQYYGCAYTTDTADCYCRYENNGVCDAGSRCPENTDIADCQCDYLSDGECDEVSGVC
eukprot:SAG11_NODE_23961_length_380_cov_1.035587_1_plen_64_part_10